MAAASGAVGLAEFDSYQGIASAMPPKPAKRQTALAAGQPVKRAFLLHAYGTPEGVPWYESLTARIVFPSGLRAVVRSRPDGASPTGERVTESPNPNRARDHLANERTFLAWVRTGAAIVVFGFAIGRFSLAMRQLTALQGHPVRTAGLSVWMGSGTIVAGVALVVAGLARYRKTRAQLDAGTFEPAGFVLDFITILTVMFGLALAAYLIYAEKVLG
jgi:putative membrane protein